MQIYTHYKEKDYLYLNLVNPLNDIQIADLKLHPYNEYKEVLAENDLSLVQLFEDEKGNLYYKGDFPKVLYQAVETKMYWLREVSDFYANLDKDIDIKAGRRFRLKDKNENEKVVLVHNNQASFLNRLDFDTFISQNGLKITKDNIKDFSIFPKHIQNTYILKNKEVYDFYGNKMDFTIDGLDLSIVSNLLNNLNKKVQINEIIFTDSLKTVYYLRYRL